MRKLASFALALAAAFSSTVAWAQSFGKDGQIVLGGDLRFAVERTSSSGNGWTSFEVQPAADFFVADNLSLGGALGLGWGGGDGDNAPSDTWLRIAPRIGFNIPISDSLSLWPQFNLAFESHWYEPSDHTRTAFGLGFNFPFAIHLARHFFVGIGPFVQTDLAVSGGDKATTFGFRTGIWGWF